MMSKRVPIALAVGGLLVIGSLLVTSLGTAARAAEPKAPFRVDVWDHGADGYHTYRIPSLLVTKKGTLLAFCEGRKTSRGDHGNLDLIVKRSGDLGATWSDQEIVHEEGGDAEVTIGNPCPVVDQDSGVIWLPFCRDNRDVLITKSDDDGRTWSKPVNITKSVKRPDWGWYATGPGVGIQLRHGPHRGRLVIPCDHREMVDGQPVMISHVFYSDDRGESWRLGGSVAPHTDECQVIETADGSLLINMRNYWERSGGRPDRGKMRAHARSRDGGETWSDLSFEKSLVEPICQASLIRFDSDGGPVCLFSNPGSPAKRVDLTVRLSRDDGKSWPVARLLQPGPAAYSCLAHLPDGSVGCLYETGTKNAYEKIRFARFTLPWLTDGAGESR